MRTILGEYGPDTPKPQAPRIMKNGPADCKPLPYDEPVGPVGINHCGPGLGGANLGNAGSQGKSSLYGDGSAGAPGITRLGGENEGGGSQRG
jgi:hypothetical protein